MQIRRLLLLLGTYLISQQERWKTIQIYTHSGCREENRTCACGEWKAIPRPAIFRHHFEIQFGAGRKKWSRICIVSVIFHTWLHSDVLTSDFVWLHLGFTQWWIALRNARRHLIATVLGSSTCAIKWEHILITGQHKNRLRQQVMNICIVTPLVNAS